MRYFWDLAKASNVSFCLITQAADNVIKDMSYAVETCDSLILFPHLPFVQSILIEECHVPLEYQSLVDSHAFAKPGVGLKKEKEEFIPIDEYMSDTTSELYQVLSICGDVYM